MPDNNLLIKNGWFGTSIFLYYYRNLESETIEKFKRSTCQSMTWDHKTWFRVSMNWNTL